MHGTNALRALHVLPPTTEAIIVTAGPVLTADAVAPLAALPALALPFLSDVVVDLDGVSALTQDGFHALLAARQLLGDRQAVRQVGLVRGFGLGQQLSDLGSQLRLDLARMRIG